MMRCGRRDQKVWRYVGAASGGKCWVDNGMSDWMVTQEDGITEVVTSVTPKGHDVRVAVGTPEGPRSGIWRFRADAKGELYVGERSTMGELKISLHRSGERFMALTKEQAESLGLPEGPARRIYQWTPKEVAPGWVHEMAIWIPASDVNTTVPPTGSQKAIRQIHWITPPPVGSATILRVLTVRLLEAGPIQFEQRGFQAVTGMLLFRPSGPEACLISATHHVLTEEQRVQMETMRRNMTLTHEERERRHARGLRVWSLANVGGTLRLHDLSYL